MQPRDDAEFVPPHELAFSGSWKHADPGMATHHAPPALAHDSKRLEACTLLA